MSCDKHACHVPSIFDSLHESVYQAWPSMPTPIILFIQLSESGLHPLCVVEGFLPTSFLFQGAGTGKRCFHAVASVSTPLWSDWTWFRGVRHRAVQPRRRD